LSFKTTLSGAHVLQSIKSSIEKLREALNSDQQRPADQTATIDRHCSKYFKGSREWLFLEVTKWLDDVPLDNDKAPVMAKKKVSAYKRLSLNSLTAH
jgi:hypothetical protein